jgi:DHA1 family inner membrane transport protein
LVTAERTLLPITAMVIFTVLAAAVYVVLPMLVGATVEVLGFSVQQAGLIAAADMLGASVSSLLVSLVLSRCPWRRLLIVGILMLTTADLLSGVVVQFSYLLNCRLLAGLGEGILLAIGNASIGESRNPDRVFGLSAAGQVAFGSPALYFMSAILTAYGLRGVFWSLAALTAASTFLVRYMPDRANQPAAATSSAINVSFSRKSILGLAGVFAYFIAQGGVWAYLDRIGTASQIDMASVGKGLAISSIAGLLGALLASWLSLRLGRLKPLLLASICSIVSLLVLDHHATFMVYAAMASLFNFAWNFSIPYELGALALVDSSRRTIAFAGVVVFGGLTVGPVIAAAVVADQNFRGVAWMGIGFCIVSVLLFARLLRPIEAATMRAG